MAKKSILTVCLFLINGLHLAAQDKMYPVRETKSVTAVPVILNSDRSAFVIEKSFLHKMTLGFPPEDRMDYLPETRAPLVILWMRIQNVSRNPLRLDLSKFTGTDDMGRMFSTVSPQAAMERIMADATGSSIGTKALRRMSLGRAGERPSEEQVKEDILRFSLRSEQIAVGGVREGFVYFEGPQRKKYTFSVSLGDLYSQQLPFSTEKQK